MCKLVLIFAATALMCQGCTSAKLNKYVSDMDNSIIQEERPKSVTRIFVSLTERPPQTVALDAGLTPTEIKCEALGSPAPTIRWFRNDEPIFEYDMVSNEIIDAKPASLARVSSKLLIHSIHSNNGVDKYNCVVSSEHKTASASTLVYRPDGATSILDRDRLIPLEPIIVVYYKALFDTIGNSVVLPCKAKGHPKPKITWFNNRGVNVLKDKRMKVLRSGALELRGLRWSDLGVWSCRAESSSGSSSADTFLYPAKAG